MSANAQSQRTDDNSGIQTAIVTEVGGVRQHMDNLIDQLRSELTVLKTQVGTLTQERFAMQHQILALQRRLMDIGEDLGRD